MPANEYYDSSGAPSTGSNLSSSTVRGEFNSIEEAFNKMPVMAAKANLPIFVNAGATGLEAITAASARTKLAVSSTADTQSQAANWLGTAAGTVDVITASATPAITSYVAGTPFRFISSGANTGAVTINIDGLGAKAITKNGTTALAAGDISSGAIVDIFYDGTQFQCVSVVVDSALRTDLAASTGAGLLGWIQSGTGAILRWIRDKLRESISVKDFGAVADWNETLQTGTDNTAAFQAALDYCLSVGGGRIKIPRGDYYLANSVNMCGTGYVPTVNGIDKPVTFYGDGRATILHCLSHAFIFNNVSATIFQYLSPVFRDFAVWGVSGASGYAFKLHQRVNLVKTLIKNVKVYNSLGAFYADSGSYITGMSVKDCDFSYPMASSYVFYVSANVEINVLSFINTWFSAGAAGAVKISAATGYAKFMDCVFESNYGQYALELTNPQVSIESCYFGSNGRTLGAAVTSGSDIKLNSGGQSFVSIKNCLFGSPDATAVTYASILAEQYLNCPYEISNNYVGLSANHQIFVGIDGANNAPSNMYVHNNNIVGATGNSIQGTDVKKFANSGDNVSVFSSSGMVNSLRTTDAVDTTMWGGSYWGPWLSYPLRDTTVIYEARIVARTIDGVIYYANIIRQVVDIKYNGDSGATPPVGTFTGTLLGVINETPVESSVWATVGFVLTNNSTGAMGVKLNVRGIAATNIQWTAEIRALGATYGV